MRSKWRAHGSRLKVGGRSADRMGRLARPQEVVHCTERRSSETNLFHDCVLADGTLQDTQFPEGSEVQDRIHHHRVTKFRWVLMRFRSVGFPWLHRILPLFPRHASPVCGDAGRCTVQWISWRTPNKALAVKGQDRRSFRRRMKLRLGCSKLIGCALATRGLASDKPRSSRNLHLCAVCRRQVITGSR